MIILLNYQIMHYIIYINYKYFYEPIFKERKKSDKYSRHLTSVDLSSILNTNDLDIISHKVRKGETLFSISNSF